MKIYTKKGDEGKTGLLGGDSHSKDTPRIHAYGTVDELNSVLGLAVSLMEDSAFKNTILEIQKQLFVLGAELATLKPTEAMLRGYIQDNHVEALEEQIDTWEGHLKPLTQFILPGGTQASAALHLARTVCRRAERLLVSLQEEEAHRSEPLKYLNRLSDWLFVFARYLNQEEGGEDVTWEGLLK